MSEPEVIDAEIVPEAPEPAPVPTTALAILEPSSGAIIRAEQPEEILAKAHQIAKPLADLIESAGLAANVGGKRKHVEVGGWQACGTLLGALGGQPLHAETIWTRRVCEHDGTPHRTTYTAKVDHFKYVSGQRQLANTTTYEVDGFDWEACVEIRTPSGVVVGRAEAMVSRGEEKWSRRDDYALRSMAETRAESRAWRKAIGWIVHLAGYNPTPAEEMPNHGTPEPVEQPRITDAETKQFVEALARLTGAQSPRDKSLMGNLYRSLSGEGQRVPTVEIAHAILAVDGTRDLVNDKDTTLDDAVTSGAVKTEPVNTKAAS